MIWMWFVFPQLRDLGHRPTAQAYVIGSLADARAALGGQAGEITSGSRYGSPKISWL